MKFTDGYWTIKPEYDIAYATEYYRAREEAGALRVLAPCVPVTDRGAILNTPALTVTISAPIENVLRVHIVHHKGTASGEPKLALSERPVTAPVTETDDSWRITSGQLTATVAKAARGWSVAFSAEGRPLTESGYRGMARALKRATGESYMIDSLMLDVGERVYGFGEKFTPYVKNGQVVDIWNEDGGTSSEISYKSVPFYMTNRGYGVLVESSADVSFEVASEKVERVQFSLPGEELTYDIFYGATPKNILERYTALTGRPALPPAWSFGLWLSTSFTTNYDEKTVGGFLDGMQKYDIPLNVFHFDCYWMKGYNWCDFEWDSDVFPEPKAMLRRLHERGLRVCVWINPFVGQVSRLCDEGMANGYSIKRVNGDVWQTDLWQAGMAVLDVTNPAARDWYCGYLKGLMDMGVDCFKTDFGERIPYEGVTFANGCDPKRMHNHYAFLYNQMVFGLLERERGIGEAVVFARSATIGGQQFPVHWGGDNSASYVSMAETLRAGLSVSHTGFGFWSHDISGFEQTAPADVYKRWVAFGMLSSHSRLHGSTSYRVPWLFDEESCAVLKEFTNLKCRLMPYLYAAAAEAHAQGTPMMRPMLLEFPDDITCETLDTQYMLGPSLLVAPVFRKDGSVDYYLPQGVWTHLLTGRTVRGGGWRHETYDFHSLPLFVREDSVLAIGRVSDTAEYDYADGVTLRLYQPKDGAHTVIVPDAKGRPAATFTVTVKDGQATVNTDSKKPYQVEIL